MRIIKTRNLKNRFLLVAVLLVSAAYCACAQDKNLPKDTYIASAIPDSLKEDANSVVRYASKELLVKGPGKSVEKYHSVVTILNEKGDDGARLVLFYDKKYSSINSVEMVVYNAAGVQIKKYHKSDFYDRSATDGISIITDSRLMALQHSIASYPTTIEINYEIRTGSYLDLGEWHIQEPEKSVQYEEYNVLALPSVGFRYKNKNTKLVPEKTRDGDYDKYTWKVTGIKATKPEEEALDWQVYPKISLATNLFEYNDLPGDFSTWQNYGKWVQKLNADVCTLDANRTTEIKAMTANLKTDKEKAKFLYEYMQHNMRYVSIQLGIGGLKPFPAMFVDQKKYGDCKALSNYMYALLKAVDIPSHYALVRAGTNEEPADAAFPKDPFNHIILCIPFKGDTTWLECTSNTQPIWQTRHIYRKPQRITANYR
jgi:transglutaminase-like putative cysteine protease